MADGVLLDVQHLKKYFRLDRRQTLHAVDDVSFQIRTGETLGLVGESGCGKTTVGRTLARLYEPDGGKILFHGQDIGAFSRRDIKKNNLASKIQMIFQDPYASLNPYFTIGEIISEGLELHHIGESRAERNEMVYELLRRVGLHTEHANRFPHEFSGGQRQRVGIARALALNPEFIICDEATSALDVSVQAQVLNMLIDLKESMGLTYLVVAHDLSLVRYISDRVAVMYLGQLVEAGSVGEVYGHPMHPYTIGLLEAVPIADPDYEAEHLSTPVQGDIGSPVNPGPGCRFAGRCPYGDDECRRRTPELTETGGDHQVACFHPVK
ncbi:MAG: ABC transporter ATP-binding protein [Lachnospiraceae bacterium]|jgi:oligopeptide transport system ATP-binding protein|nr:ABC transporter ATP-binding protein [Lachnospiraceae bacterium]